MNTIEILNKNECCGCSGCLQKCPVQAITMLENEEGFFYPVIDKEKCIECGLCVKICPQLKEAKVADKGFPKAYAMYNKNEKDLLESSSGGIFSVIANYVLDNNGVVFGAAYDKSLSVNHIKVGKKEQLELLRGSKYLQSNIQQTYKEAEKYLKEGKKVLFTGTPCQIAGINAFLMKTYDNLITCDLVCHGVPSQKLFKKYLEYLSDKFGSKVVYYNFRSKEAKGWGLNAKVITEDGKVRFISPDFDPYYSNFLESNTYRQSCYNCHYTNHNRVADITLADYWGINNIHPEFYSEKGRSLILINNSKGEELIDKLSVELEKIETNLEYASSKNKNLIEPSKRSTKRDIIYDGIDELNARKYIKTKLKVNRNAKKIIRSMLPKKLKKFLKKVKGKIKKC